ncbi:MAG: hypothetical protein LH645_06955 [Actinomycetia bacterium]|nr:hypothetical protein [Actinomycetes bacterium]
MIIDCDGCGVRGDACGDCVVAVLLGAPPDLQADERRALGVLAEAGLVPPLRLVAGVVGGESAGPPDLSESSVRDDTPGSSTRAV